MITVMFDISSEARRQFPALEEKVFLDAGCTSLAPIVAIEAVRELAEEAACCRAPSATRFRLALDERRERARGEIARLIGARPSEIALVESTTHGINIAASAIPLAKGDKVLICDLDFLTVAMPWFLKRDEIGIEVEVIRTRGGAIGIEDFADRLDKRTRVVAVSSVLECNGFRCDLAALGRLCRERGAYLVVDAIQQVGAIGLDVSKIPVDFLACGGHKWLNAPFGTGFLYIRNELLGELNAPLCGYAALQVPAGGWESYLESPSTSHIWERYRFVSEARKYEIGGTPNYLGAVGLGAAVGLINSLGMERIEAHIYELTDYLIKGLAQLGASIVTPLDRRNRAGIVTFRAFDAAAEDKRLVEKLLSEKIMVSMRYAAKVGGVRVSCHFFNNRSDVDKLLNALEKFMRFKKA